MINIFIIVERYFVVGKCLLFLDVMLVCCYEVMLWLFGNSLSDNCGFRKFLSWKF